jgi:hypothetical protein
MDNHRKPTVKFFVLALFALIMVNSCQSKLIASQPTFVTDTSYPTATSSPEPLPTSIISATQTEPPVEYDYSGLPSLNSLIVSKELISESISLTPSLLFYSSLVIKPVDVVLIDDCGVDCVNLEYFIENQSLIISLVRYQSENEAQNQVEYLWNEITPDIPYIWITDEFEGIGDYVWAAQDNTTLYNVRREGPVVIYMSDYHELHEGSVDFDGNHYLGELSCLGKIQAQILQIASTGSTPYIEKEPDSCWEWLW